MNGNVGELLQQGLVISALGIGLVFAALGLLWALITLLGVELKPGRKQPQRDTSPALVGAPVDERLLAESKPEEADLTTERARVAVIVASALLANALPLLFAAPTGPAFEHGRTAPSWVIANRARALPSWQPARRPDLNDSGVGEGF